MQQPIDVCCPEAGYRDYGYTSAAPSHMHVHFMPRIFELAGNLSRGTRVLDVGCGNGYTVGCFLERGCTVVGIDLSEQGIAIARTTYPRARFEVAPADDHLLDRLGERPFDLVISTEVVEHVYAPRPYAAGCFRALRPGGRFICTTPYHGYLKNIAIAVTNTFDRHVNPLWDGGHIKFWSKRTLTELLRETGFVNFQFRGAGRLPWMWMTMVVSGDRPNS